MAGISSLIRGTVSSGSLPPPPPPPPSPRHPSLAPRLNIRSLFFPICVSRAPGPVFCPWTESCSVVRVPGSAGHRLNLKFQPAAADKSTTNRNVVPRSFCSLELLAYPRLSPMPMKFIGVRDLEPIACPIDCVTEINCFTGNSFLFFSFFSFFIFFFFFESLQL